MFDKEFKKLWAVQLKEWDVDSKAWPIDPIPGSWFCLKDHYGPVYDPRGKPLWALYDGTEFRGDKHYYGVVELVSDTACSCMLLYITHDVATYGASAVKELPISVQHPGHRCTLDSLQISAPPSQQQRSCFRCATHLHVDCTTA